MSYDVEAIRKDFPILNEEIHGKKLVYLDNAATTQKPRAVLDVLAHYYEHDNANIHRGVHTLAERATKKYEDARTTVAKFINAPSREEIVFTRGTTEAINLVAQSFGQRITKEQSIIISEMEHHSNIVPWQLLCERTGAQLKVIPVTDDGRLDLDAYAELLDDHVALVSIVHVSNALGTINPISEMVTAAHDVGAKFLVDGAQAAPHMRVDVQKLGCDFYVFSGHKVYGPTGVGALWGKKALLDSMPPYQGGGEMIRSVKFTGTTYNDVPYKFEAGTPNIAGGIGLGAAIDYVEKIGLDAIGAHEDTLLKHATKRIKEIDGVRIIGTSPRKAGVLSFVIDGVHPHDIGSLLDREGVAVRTGHHCAQPIMERYGLPATSRASFGVYNTMEEVDIFIDALAKIRGYFA